MGLLKNRPTLAFSGLAGELIGGETLTGELIAKCTEPVPVDWIKISLKGKERARVGSGKTATSASLDLCHLAAIVCNQTELEVGTHRYPFAIKIPVQLPPTYQSSAAKTWYELRARASIPWWPDAKISQPIQIAAPAAAASHPGDPLILSTRPEGPEGTNPYVEVSLSQRVFATGDVVRGAIALRNVEHNRYRSVRLSLVAHQEARVSGTRQRSKSRKLEFSIDVSAGREGEQLPFELRIEPALEPTFTSALWSHSWRLRVDLDVAWGLDPTIELDTTIVEPRYRQLERARAAPMVGAPRLEACWKEVADDRGLELLGSAMRGGFGNTSISIWREQSARGPTLVAKVTYPSLGLGLEIKPATGFFFGRGRAGIQIGNQTWDKSHEIHARSLEQCEGVVASLAGQLAEFSELSMSDNELVYTTEGTGNRASDLEAFVAPIVAIAERIEEVRKNISPPPSAARVLPVWRELAATLDGEINTANLAISGRFHSHPVTVAASWSADGEPVEITVTLELKEPFADAQAFALTPTLLPELPDALPTSAIELVASLTGVASRVEARGDMLSASCQWLADPRHSISVLRTLAEIAEALAPGAGPFR